MYLLNIVTINFRYSKEEPFSVISVDIRNHSTLFDSLEQYVKGELLEGADAYHCEKCNKKVLYYIWTTWHLKFYNSLILKLEVSSFESFNCMSRVWKHSCCIFNVFANCFGKYFQNFCVLLQVVTVKRLCVKKLPPILAIQLKRFEYDFERVCAIKFNDYFEFPRDLDMDPYTGKLLFFFQQK